jgi:PAS domain S-box-containing protein
MDVIDELKLNKTVPVLVANQEGLIEFVNSCFEEIFGWSQAEIVGRPLTLIIPEHLRDAHHLGFSRFLHTEQPTLMNKTLELAAMKKNGEIFVAEHVIYASKQKGSWFFGATLVPVKGAKK